MESANYLTLLLPVIELETFRTNTSLTTGQIYALSIRLALLCTNFLRFLLETVVGLVVTARAIYRNSQEQRA